MNKIPELEEGNEQQEEEEIAVAEKSTVFLREKTCNKTSFQHNESE